MSAEPIDTTQPVARPVESEQGLLLTVLLMVLCGVGAIFLMF